MEYYSVLMEYTTPVLMEYTTPVLMEIGCSELLVLLFGTTSVFWGMHLSGAMGLPRRMPDAPDMYMHVLM